MKKISLIASIVGACAIVAIVPGTIIGVMNNTVVTNNNSSNDNNDESKPSVPDKPSNPSNPIDPSEPENQNKIYEYNIEDVIKSNVELISFKNNVFDILKNSIENQFNDFQQKQFIINLLESQFQFGEDLPPSPQVPLKQSLLKSEIPNIKNIDINQNKNKLTFNLNKIVDKNVRKYLYTTLIHNGQVHYPMSQVEGENQKIEISYENIDKKIGIIESKVFDNIEDAKNFKFDNKDQFSFYLAYIKTNNNLCNMYLIPNYYDSNFQDKDKIKIFDIKYFLNTTESANNALVGSGRPTIMNPVLIPGKLLIEN